MNTAALRRTLVLTTVFVTLAMLCAAALARAGGTADGARGDLYVRGYVSAVLERDFGLPDAVVDVRDGVVYVREESVPEGDRAKLRDALGAVKGVADVRCVTNEQVAAGPEEAPAPPSSAPAPVSGTTFLPPEPLFHPVIGDPRWPRFSATWQWYLKDPSFTHIGSATFGGVFPVVQSELPGGGRWDLGVQAGVFSIFNMDASSVDLVNADYWVGLPLGARWGPLAFLFRLYHQSSHLGDEFLLDTPIHRINLSFEAVDALVGYDLWGFGRVYGGGGYLVHKDPADLKPGYTQTGVEVISPWALLGDTLRPLAVLDVQWHQEEDWGADYSTRFGFRVENPRLLGTHHLYLLGEFYDGHSPNGQFFVRRIQSWGSAWTSSSSHLRPSFAWSGSRNPPLAQLTEREILRVTRAGASSL
ncbi:MAG TPA: DUF1207 domain-containing protein [Myxococcota bacterium]|nr:DUF1207 domain-containing protein [Myxococcota bacterium]